MLPFVENSFTPGVNITVHIQVFDVSNNCNENNFFDVYTPNDTHIYNMRDIQTNDGNSAGFVLPDGAYGFVFALVIEPDGVDDPPEPGTIWNDAEVLIGNLRILDNNGYEYRTNGQSENAFDPDGDIIQNPEGIWILQFQYSRRSNIVRYRWCCV